MRRNLKKIAAAIMSATMVFSSVPSSFAATVDSGSGTAYSVQKKTTKLASSSGGSSTYAAVLRSDKVGNAAQTETTDGYSQQVETKMAEATSNATAAYFEQDKYISGPTGTKNGQSTYNITIENGYVGPKVITYAPNGQDIVIIEDASSSMNGHTDSETEALTELINKIHDTNVRRIDDAMNGVYDGTINPEGKTRDQVTQEMINGGHLLRLVGICDFNWGVDSQYNSKSYLLTTSDVNAAITAAKNGLSHLDDTTRTDIVLSDMYTNYWKYISDYSNTSIILITDGAPYDWTNSCDNGYLMSSTATNTALDYATKLKARGTTIYTLFTPWDSNCDLNQVNAAAESKDISKLATNGELTPRGNLAAAFISLASSDYASGTLNTVSGSTMFNNTMTYTANGNGYGTYSKYIYDSGKIVESIASVATQIAKETYNAAQKAAGYASVESYVLDDISYPFELNGNISNIKVYQVPRVPTELDSTNHVADASNVTSFTWGEKEDITDQVEVSLEGNRIKISGYNYEANALTNYDHDLILDDDKKPSDPTAYETGDYGYKLVVEFPICAKASFGGNDIETNDSTTSGFYPSSPSAKSGKPEWTNNTGLNANKTEYVALYPVPTVDLDVNYSIPSSDVTIYAPQTAKLLNLVTNDANSADALSIFSSTHIPDGDNNAYVDITYTLKSPSGKTVGTLNIPHGTALTGGKDNTGNIKWTFTDGDDATIAESGTYTIDCTVTPVKTTRAESHTGSSDADESCQAVTYTAEPKSTIYQLQITVKDTSKKSGQTIDFTKDTTEDVFGAVSSTNWNEIHWADAKWVCIDGSTESQSSQEPGKGNNQVGSKPVASVTLGSTDNISEADGTTYISEKALTGTIIPARVSVTRNAGNLNKDASVEEKNAQTTMNMSDDDHLYGEYSSIVWKHECDVADDCDNNELAEARKTLDGGATTGQNITRFLIHVEAIAMPGIEKTTSTPSILLGEDIEWTVKVSNDKEETNTDHKKTSVQMLDVLPYKNDGRTNTNDNTDTGSDFDGNLYLKSVSLDCSSATNLASEFANGEAKFYYTTDTAVRTATKEQWYAGGTIVWTEVTPLVNGNTVTFDVPSSAVAIKSDVSLEWGEAAIFNMTANIDNKKHQYTSDTYINLATIANDDKVVDSDPVVTEVKTLSISGKVWYDDNRNGQYDGSEGAVKNITVSLYKELENASNEHISLGGLELEGVYSAYDDYVSATATDENGYYEFSNLKSGTYYVVATGIESDYKVTTKEAEGTDNALNSKAEETMPTGQTAWITKVVVGKKIVDYQNIGLVIQKGTLTVNKVLENGELYYTASATDEQKAEATKGFTFKLTNNTTGEEYSSTIVLDASNAASGVSAIFEDLPLGTYTLEEEQNLGYELVSMTGDESALSFNSSTQKATITIVPGNTVLTATVTNKASEANPGVYPGETVVNHVGTATPIQLKVTYSHGAINDTSIASYTFVQSDFENITLWYDDGTYRDFTGTYRKNADNTVEQIGTEKLSFSDVTLSPATITNEKNSSGRVAVSAYYTEKNKTLSDTFNVSVNLMPVYKFTVTFHGNGSTIAGSDSNKVKFRYNDSTGQNNITGGVYNVPDVRSGWTFTGWNTASDGSGTQYSSLTALDSIGAAKSSANNIDLYATWTTQVTFNANGGTLSGGSSAAETSLAGSAYGSVTVKNGTVLTTGLTATATNYQFLRWNTSPDGNGTDIASYGEVTGPVTFYAIYVQTYWSYGYTGDVQAFTAPISGTYRLTALGATGGAYGANGTANARTTGGKTQGDITLNAGQTIYVYVGSAGGDSLTTGQAATGGWNGGGTGGTAQSDNEALFGCGGGGGATDFRTVNSGSDWSNATGLASRIMVAGGGGGGGRNGYGGYGGAPNAGDGSGNWLGEGTRGGSGGTQTSGGDPGGSFGIGASANNGRPNGGGGGGWYGGGATPSYPGNGGGGGSSYISGASGCGTSSTGLAFTNCQFGYAKASRNSVDGMNGSATVQLL